MPQSVLKINEQDFYLDNALWKREHFLKNHVILHTIQCQKISNELVKRLEDRDFKVIDSGYNQSVSVQSRKGSDFTEIHEMRLDKLKVTEAVIVSHLTPNGGNKRLLVNESEPTRADQRAAKNSQLRGPLTLIDKSVDITELETNTEASGHAETDIASHDYTKIEHEHIVLRHEVVRKKNSFFLKSKDSANLFKLGNSYYEDFKNGCRNFLFTNLSAPEDQKKTILGIASFIYYYENLKILIMSHHMQESFYAQFTEECNKQEVQTAVYPSFKYDLYVHEGLHYLDVNHLEEKSQEDNSPGFEAIIINLVLDFDVVLFDLPSFEKDNYQQKVGFPVLQMVENVSFVVAFSKDTFSEMETLQKYFNDYNIKVKGIVIGRE